MRFKDQISVLELAGHRFSTQGGQDGQVRVVSTMAMLTDDQTAWIRANRASVSNLIVGRALSNAIEQIEEVFDPSAPYPTSEQSILAAAPLNSIKDIDSWSARWLALIESTKGAFGGQARNA